MKTGSLSLILCILSWCASAQSGEVSIGAGYLSRIYQFPTSAIPIHSFEVNENGQALVPLNGGIYIPQDTVWLIPPMANQYILSFALNLKDTAVVILTRNDTACQLRYLKTDAALHISSTKILDFQLGLYNLIVKDKIMYVWGISGKSYKIGIVTPTKIKWIIDIPDKITAVEVINKDSVYFATGNAIIDIKARKSILLLDTTISGFVVTDKGKFVVSTPTGIFSNESGKIEAIASGLQGAIRKLNNDIYLLSDKRSLLWKLKRK